MFVFGFFRGLAVFYTAIASNQNYDSIKALGEGDTGLFIVLGVGAFIVISLAILLIMIVSGLLQLLAGRRMPQRWMTILGFLIGAGGGSWLYTAIPVVL